ncbi:MAG: hypothetical protein ACRC11_00865 [Xenococcaceae cyanobacterium]
MLNEEKLNYSIEPLKISIDSCSIAKISLIFDYLSEFQVDRSNIFFVVGCAIARSDRWRSTTYGRSHRSLRQEIGGLVPQAHKLTT